MHETNLVLMEARINSRSRSDYEPYLLKESSNETPVTGLEGGKGEGKLDETQPMARHTNGQCADSVVK